MAKPQIRERDDRFEGSFTDKWVKATKGYENEVQYAERLKKGLSLMLYVSPPPSETKTWRVLFYDGGKPRSKRIGTYPAMSVAAARRHAYDEFDPDREIASANAGTFKKVSDDWLEDHVIKQKLRSRAEIERQLKAYVLPALGQRPIFEIKRRDVNKLLREIKRKHGAPQADAVLATIRNIMGWFAADDDDYASVIVPKMKRDKRKAKEKERNRKMSHEEIRALWKACDDLPIYGDMLRLLLLTGQRLRKVSEMQRTDIAKTREVELKRGDEMALVSFNNVWTVRTEDGEKGNIGAVALPDLAMEIIERQPKIAKNPHVFPAAFGKGPINSFSQQKAELDKKLREILPDMEPWVVHDLRRTARSLLTELRVPDDIAERTLGHTIKGVERVYNRYDYFEEKTETLQKLANFIQTILNPPNTSNVENIAAHAGRRRR